MKRYLARLVERAAPAGQTPGTPSLTSLRARDAKQSEEPFGTELIEPPPPDVAQVLPARRPARGAEHSPARAGTTAPLRPPASGQARDLASPPPLIEPPSRESPPAARGSESTPEVEPPSTDAPVRPPESSIASERGAAQVEPPAREPPPRDDEAQAVRLADQFMEKMLGRISRLEATPTVEPPGERAGAMTPVLKPPSAPEPSAPAPAEAPSLVINQLRVDVVSPPPVPARAAPRLGASRGPRGGAELAPPSSLRFGLGQV